MEASRVEDHESGPCRYVQAAQRVGRPLRIEIPPRVRRPILDHCPSCLSSDDMCPLPSPGQVYTPRSPKLADNEAQRIATRQYWIDLMQTSGDNGVRDYIGLADPKIRSCTLRHISPCRCCRQRREACSPIWEDAETPLVYDDLEGQTAQPSSWSRQYGTIEWDGDLQNVGDLGDGWMGWLVDCNEDSVGFIMALFAWTCVIMFLWEWSRQLVTADWTLTEAELHK
jgi:hypothetical protein